VIKSLISTFDHEREKLGLSVGTSFLSSFIDHYHFDRIKVK